MKQNFSDRLLVEFFLTRQAIITSNLMGMMIGTVLRYYNAVGCRFVGCPCHVVNDIVVHYRALVGGRQLTGSYVHHTTWQRDTHLIINVYITNTFQQGNYHYNGTVTVRTAVYWYTFVVWN